MVFSKLKLIPAVLWTAFIVYGLLSEPSAVPKFPWLALKGVDKLIHAVLFAVEAALVVWAFGQNMGFRLVSGTLIWCLFLGGGLELVQHYHVPGRYGEVLDLLADMAGALAGTASARAVLKK